MNCKKIYPRYLPLSLIIGILSFSISAQNVGIGTATPASKLSVAGNVSIGNSYATTAAPANGLVIQGNVGIGVSNPISKLHIQQSGTQSQTLYLSHTTSNSLSYGLLVVASSTASSGSVSGGYFSVGNSNNLLVSKGVYIANTANSSSNRGIEVAVSGSTSASNYGAFVYTSGGTTNYGLYSSASGGTTNWAGWFGASYLNDGRVYIKNEVGIGTTTLSEKLNVNGAIKISNTTGANVGTIRYTGSDFEGYMAGSWHSLTAGSDGDWTVSGNNMYSAVSGNVGIGVSAPITKLQVQSGYDVLFGSSMSGAGSKTYWDASQRAFRTGYVSGTQWDAANVGLYSFATGYNTTASASNSTALGYNNTASGTYSTVIGYSSTASGSQSLALGANNTASGNLSFTLGNNNTASGYNSLALGFSNLASANYSLAMGVLSTAQSYNVFTIGRYNVGGGNATSWINTDPLFEIGNGISSAHANAMTVLKNGNVGIGISVPVAKLQVQPGYDVLFGSSMSGAGSKTYWDASQRAFRTGYVSGTQWDAANVGLYSFASGTNTTASGSRSVAMGNGTTASGTNAVALGLSNTSSGTAAFSSGNANTVSGNYAAALGAGNTSSGDNSITLGSYSTSSATNAISVGYNNTVAATDAFAAGYANTINSSATGSIALGYNNTISGTAAGGAYAIGNSNTVSGWYATSIGYHTTSQAMNDFVIGRYNIGGGTTNAWYNTEPLFEIGNGTSTTHANAMTVLKNGNVGIGTATPSATFDLVGTFQYVDGNQTNGYILKTDASGNATWADPAGISDADWTVSGSDMYSAVSSNVGIGTSTPASKLELNYSGTQTTGLHNTYVYSGTNTGTGITVDASLSSGINIYSGIFNINSSASATNTTALFAQNSNSGATNNYGLKALVGNSGTNNYAVYAYTTGATSNDWAGYFGHSTYSGRVYIKDILTIGTTNPGNATARVSASGLYGLHATTNYASASSVAIYGKYEGTGGVNAKAFYGYSLPQAGYGLGGYFYGGFIGIQGIANNTSSSTSYGLYANAYGGSGNRYGVYGNSSSGTGTRYAGYFSGDLAYTGTLISVSDRMFKTDVQSLPSALSKLMQLKAVNYYFNQDIANGAMHFPNRIQTGFVAQDLGEIFPELIVDATFEQPDSDIDPIDYKGVNYIGMIPILTKSIQEQQSEIEKQNQNIEELKLENDVLKEQNQNILEHLENLEKTIENISKTK